MNDALILYDPTGFVKQMQVAVHSVYMQPKWLNKRLTFWLDLMRTNLAQFKEAGTAADALRICKALGWFTFGCSSIPLLRGGITPSSTRGLLLLGPIAPTLKAQLAQFEGSAQMSVDDIVALEPLLQEAIPLFAASYGQLPAYFVTKALWMARQGHYQEALHTLWMYMGAGAAQGCLDRNDSAQLWAGADLMERWLQRLAMHEPSVLAVKIQVAEELLAQIEALVNETGDH